MSKNGKKKKKDTSKTLTEPISDTVRADVPDRVVEDTTIARSISTSTLTLVLFGFLCFTLGLAAGWIVSPSADPARSMVTDPPTVAKPEKLEGIDVSHWQGEIDWPKVAQDSVHFVYVKATEGATTQDTRFVGNWQAAKSNGLLRGAYHFFHADQSPSVQATNFIERVGVLEPDDLPPVLDVEISEGFDADALVGMVESWLTIVEQSLGRRAIIYSDESFYEAMLAKGNLPNGVWIAQWDDPPKRLGRSWTFWQYTNSGVVAGINGAVSRSRFYGSRDELASLMAGPAQGE